MFKSSSPSVAASASQRTVMLVCDMMLQTFLTDAAWSLHHAPCRDIFKRLAYASFSACKILEKLPDGVVDLGESHVKIGGRWALLMKCMT